MAFELLIRLINIVYRSRIETGGWDASCIIQYTSAGRSVWVWQRVHGLKRGKIRR